MIMAQGDDRGWNALIEDLGDPKAVARARAAKAKDPNNGDIVKIDVAAFLNLLPMPIRNRVKDMGHVARYFAIPSMQFATILERCLEKNKGNGSLLNYNSSDLKKQNLIGDLVYYAIMHVDVTPPRTSLGSRFPSGEGCGEGGNNSDVVIVAIYKRGDDGSIVLSSANNVMDIDKWIDDVSTAYITWNAGRQNKIGDIA
jgi:hypothetical protein